MKTGLQIKQMRRKQAAARKSWRCFHCDEVFRSRKTAWLHFGPDEACEKLPPACIDPLRYDEEQRLRELREAQEYALQCQEDGQRIEEEGDQAVSELAEFKRITGCENAHDLRMWLDAQKGRVVTANSLINGFRKADPRLAAEIIG